MPPNRKPEPLPPPSGPPRQALGVIYEERDAAPGLKFFSCAPMRASMSMKGCASRWKQAQTAYGTAAEDLAACRGCAIGAAHAGYAPVRYSAWYASGICGRCGRGGMRIIGERRCVSCYNREREVRLRTNGRGNLPVELLRTPPHTMSVLVEVDGSVRRLIDPESSGMTETIVQVLRTTKGEIAFGFAAAPGARDPLSGEAPPTPAR